MKVRYMEAVLRSLKPRKIKYDVHDPDGTGLLLRVSPRGRKTWMVSYRSEIGVKHQRAIGNYPGMTIHEAREAAAVSLGVAQEAGD